MTSKIKVDNINKVSDDSNIINKCGTAINVGASGNTVTVTGNDIRSDSYKAADGGVIISQSGTAVTIGASGDTINLASGASQSGFGRTGTVDWQTGSIKTGNFTAASGEGYFVNTTSGAITATLPSSPSAGDIVAVADYAGTAGSNNITIGRGGSNIEGGTTDGTISTNRETKTLVYVDGTQGWVPVNDNFDSTIPPAYIVATSPNVATVGDYKIHTFTGPGTFTVCSVGNSGGSNTVDYLVVAGGGGGGGTQLGGNNRAGGGGAGGYRESSGTASGSYTVSPLGACVSALPVTAQGYPIDVGGGGAGSFSGRTNGSNSIFSTITSTGGGFGSECSPSPDQAASTGGSGGGSAARGTLAAGNTPPVSPPQGQSGGASSGFNGAGGGGGGAGAAGSSAPTGAGGAGVTSSINNTPTTRAGGGGGPGGVPCNGGAGGGGDANGGAGAVNTGGGGAGDYPPDGSNTPSAGGGGGSGIVIIRYKFQN